MPWFALLFLVIFVTSICLHRIARDKEASMGVANQQSLSLTDLAASAIVAFVTTAAFWGLFHG